MYKVASDNAQRRASRITMQEAQTVLDERLTKEAERQNLVAIIKSVESKLVSSPRGTQQRKELARQKTELMRQITELRPKMKGPKNIEGFFVKVCQERMTKAQFSIFMVAAANMARDSINDQDIDES